MILLGELRVEATLDNLRLISHFCHGISERLRLSERTLFHIDLAVEEAAANIVSYAYPPDQAGEILIRAERRDDEIWITLDDWGMPLDPHKIKPFDLDAPIETRIKGGMGLHLIHSLMDRVARETAQVPGDPNTLLLVKRIEHAPAQVAPSHDRGSNTMQELDAMLTISRIITANLDLDDLLKLILNELARAIDADLGALYLIDEEKDELFTRVMLKEIGDLHKIRLKVGEGIAGHVAATGEVLNTRSAYDDPRFLPVPDQVSGYRSNTMLTAPMRTPQQKTIGVVQLVNKKSGTFSAQDERLLTAMASQAAIVIENARLYAQEIQQRLTSQELGTARTIQTGFLPRDIPQHPGWDIAACWHPAQEVAGDFYDFYPLPDGRLAIAIADVSGKGVPAALFMAFSVTVLRFAMGLNFGPAALLDRANRSILSDQQSSMFATAFVGYLDLDSGTIEFALAGHNPPLLYRAATGQCHAFTASGVAMGVFEEATYVEETVTLQPEDVLVLYTDGITEMIDAQENEFGEERLKQLVVQHASRPAGELAELIIEAAATFAQDRGAFDDETLVVIRRQPTRR
ncbi:MAG: SpoIIE family protein phosphatase [Anaerolineae bacterium]|nr:SpoIIE family protein phosphatase [Anaerolineae bacterium]